MTEIIYKAAKYIRLSYTDDKSNESDSVVNQRKMLDRYIESQPDIKVVSEYVDDGVSGIIFDRPKFKEMMAAIEAGEINCVLVKDLSRLGREYIETGRYLRRIFPALGVRFIAITDGFDSNYGDGGALLPLKNVIAEAYALDISRKCRAMQRQNIADGRFVGRMAPYGLALYPVDCHKLIINTEAAAVVHKIFDWAKLGTSAGEIARRLNDEKILPPSRYKVSKGIINHDKIKKAEHWHGRIVSNILTDRMYVGDIAQGKTQTVDHKKIPVPKNDWVVVPNTHAAIVERSVFDTVQRFCERLAAKDAEKQSYGEYSPHLFKGKVYCAKCGHILHRHRQNKDGTYWFRCGTTWKFGKDLCTVVSVKEADLKSEILAILHKQAEALLGRYISIGKAENPAKSGAETELKEINAALDKDGRMLKSLYENLVSGILSRDEFIQMKADYEAKIAALSVRADAIRNARSQEETQAEKYRDFADAVSAAISDDKLTGEIIERLIDKILVYPDKSFDVLFKFANEYKEVA
jgi:DNA invertase Pin-like site-specific DNA recombinase